MPDTSAPRLPSTGRGAGRPVDTAALAAVLDEFAATVTGDFTIADILRQLVLGVTRVLEVAGAGVAAPGPDGELLHVAYASDGRAKELESLQEDLQEGPCRHAHGTGEVVNLGDLREEGAWPAFQSGALDIGVHALAAIPLQSRGRRWGVLDVYRGPPVAFSVAELAAGTTLANLATSYLVVTDDRDTARRAQREVAERALRDTLTGLPVRWVFLEQLARSLAGLRRTPGHVAVLFLDVDGLKYVNDTYGHTAGDRLITTCVARIRGALRPADLLSRIGGDEFAVLLDGLERPEDAAKVAQRVLDALRRPDRRHRDALQPSASIGVAHTDDPDLPGATLIAHADSAMYRAKRSQRGRYEVFDPETYAVQRARAAEREQLIEDLLTALPSDQLAMHYQPLVDVASEEQRFPGGEGLFGVEALLRWRHPRRGLLTAGAFMDTAERAGLLPALGEWGMRTACRQMVLWDEALGARAPRRLFFNLSTVELVDPTLVGRVGTAFADAGLDPQRVTLEITEGGLLPEADVAADVLGALRDLGCELAIDDFGSGYSSLSRLTEIPATTIKVDQAFAHRVGDDSGAAAVISAVLALGTNLDRTVVVEGVEDEESLAALLRLGVTHVQGYHLARPMAAAALTAALASADR
jgi:diguanylate cyclase (GGDEF)-like protein